MTISSAKTFRSTCFAIFAALCVRASAQSFPFVIPGDDSLSSVTDRSVLLDKPAGVNGFVQRKGSKFFTGDKRIRFWGVNLCFGANFPTHEQADLLAPHLAKLGVNAVRFHHMDMQAAPSGIWSAEIKDGQRTFDPEMVDRLDYLLAKLHEHGVYADLNLHVSRTLTDAEGFPALVDGPWWSGANKWVMYYDKDVQAKVKDYCRDLLTHENPYRDKKKRVDDPGIALVEMLNENYFSVQGYSLAGKLQKRFQDSLLLTWNQWLTEQYGSQAKMVEAWQGRQLKLGEPLFPVATFKTELAGWGLTRSAEELTRTFDVAGPDASGSLAAIRIAPVKILEHDFNQQMHRGGLSVRADDPYTLTFWVRADRHRTFKAELSTTNGGEWRELGLFEPLDATPTWTKISRVILPKETIDGAVNLVMTVGNDTTPIEFSGIELRSGVAPIALPNYQSLDHHNISIPDASSPLAAHLDMKRFMVETEQKWVSELKTYLTKELGVKVPITASQVNYHVPEIVENQLDFVDLHCYWHHPIFPSGGDWNPENWTIQNEPMEGGPTNSKWPMNSVLMRTGWRFADLPMTMTEWNYPEPSFFSGGCVPMAAIIMGLQDWDGVFFFDYDAFGGNEEPNHYFRDSTVNYFSFNAAPVKLALFSQMANVVLRGDLDALKSEAVSDPAHPIDGRYGLLKKLGVRGGAAEPSLPTMPDVKSLTSDGNQVIWNSTGKGDGYMVLNTPATRGVWGTIGNQSFNAGSIQIETKNIDPNYGFVLISSVDGKPLESASRSIVTIASHAENQAMGWNQDKTSVGTKWGHGPTLVTTFEAQVTVPHAGDLKRVHAYALDGRGQRIREVPLTPATKSLVLNASPTHQTLWYELSVD